MREYELIYVLQPDLADEREAEIHGKLDDAVSRGEGMLLLRDDWGKRKLAYEVRKFQKGHYFQLNFLGDGKSVPDIERLLRLDVDVLRFLTVLADEDVKDVEARVARAKEQAAEQARRREERERFEIEREILAAEIHDSKDAVEDSIEDADEEKVDEGELLEPSVEQGE